MTLKFCTLKFRRRAALAPLAVSTLWAGALLGLTPGAARAVPVVLNHTETAQPGDVVYLEGTWGSTLQVRGEVVPAGTAPNVNSALSFPALCSNAGNTHHSGSYVTVQVPSNATYGLYAVWLNDGSGWSAPTYINQAHGTHCSFSEVSPGFAFDVFGRNLVLSGYTPTVRFVDTKTNQSYTGTVNGSASEGNYLNVTMPSGVPVGDSYSVIVNNGAGGSSGDSPVEEGTTVAWPSGAAAPSTPINGSSVAWNLNVPWQADYDGFCSRVINAAAAPYGVAAGGFTGEAQAQANAQGLQNAMNAASSAGGGVVYLPAGTYAFDWPNGGQSDNNILFLPANVVVMGAGSGSTILDFGYSALGSSNEPTLFRRHGAGTTGLLNLGFNYVGAAYSVNPAYGELACSGWGSEWFLQGCVLNMGTAPSWDCNSSNFLLVQNSTITESGQNTGQMTFHGETGAVFAGNTISYNRCRNWAGPPGGVSDVLFYNNHFTRTAAVPSVPGYEAGGFDMYGSRVVFLDNTFDVGAGNKPNTNNNDGEQILAEEGGGSFISGRLTSSTSSATSTTITDTSKSWTSGSLANGGAGELGLANQNALLIVSGPETGEWGYITGNTGDTVTVSPALPVTPTAGDEYEVGGWTASEWLIDANTFSNNVRGIWFNGNCWSNVVVGNTMTNDDGIQMAATQGALGYGAGGGGTDLTDPQVITPIWDTQVYNNTIADSPNPAQYIPSELTSVFTVINDAPTILGTGILGYECRRNSLTVDTPNCGFAEGTPTPGTAGSPDNHLLAENYINTVMQQYDPGSPSPGDPHYNWFLFPNPPPYDANDTGILGSVFQGNTSANQTGTDVTRLWTGTVVNSLGSAYWLGTGVSNTTVADPTFSSVGNPIYDPNGLNYNAVPSDGGAIDYQAEYGVPNGTVTYGDSSASGGAYAAGFNGTGASCTINNVDGEVGGVHLLTLRYATPSASSIDLYANGSMVTTLSLPATGGWGGYGNWGTVSALVPLSAGTGNVVKLQRDAANGAFNADKITVQ